MAIYSMSAYKRVLNHPEAYLYVYHTCDESDGSERLLCCDLGDRR